MSSRWRTWTETAPQERVNAAIHQLCLRLARHTLLHSRINERARLKHLRFAPDVFARVMARLK